MLWTQMGVVANVTLTVAYLAIATSILLPLARTGQLWTNRLGLTTGLIFFSCGIGHLIHVDHTVRLLLADGYRATDIDWHLGLWDSITGVFAVAYWRQRHISGPPVDPGTMFEDLRRKQKELEAQALESGLREELAVEREIAARQSFARAFESAPNGMALIDGSGVLVRVNRAFAAIVGQTVAELAGVPLSDLLVAQDGQPAVPPAAQGEGVEAVEVQLRRSDATSAWVRVGITPLAGTEATALVQLDDVTERRQAQARLHHLALHDPLTGLPNRLLFHDRAASALRQALRTRSSTACLFVDLDHFKVVNDSLGHTAGDRVLVAVAERLSAILRPGDTVARMGGDEFCLLLLDLEDPAEAVIIADRVIAALDGYVDIDGLQVTTGASVGVAVVRPSALVTSQTLVRDADAALYRAKGIGRGHQVVFDDAIRDDAERRMRVEAELRRGLGAHELTVAYQPQWSLGRRRIVGIEALARWQHPILGELEPAEFMAVAVEAGLVVPLGRAVLDQALRELAVWRTIDPELELAVNLSSRQLSVPGFVDEVQTLLEEHQVPATSLCLELTETDLATLGRSALSTLDELRGRGIRLAVDDVGTGQSSLTHLVTLPIDVIKIDRSFVEQVHVHGAKRAVVEALLSLAATIGVDVVAEGPETLEQAATLEALGCDVVQGYIVSRPVPASAMTDLLQRSDPRLLELVGAADLA